MTMSGRCTLLVNSDNCIEEAMQVNIFSDIRTSYCAVIPEMVKIFLFDGRVINDLVVLDSIKRNELTCAPIVRLAERVAPLVD